jgi:hypothetical protein
MHQSRPKVAIALLAVLAAIGLVIVPTAAMGSSSQATYPLNAGGPALAGEPQWIRDTSRKPSVYVTSPTSRTAFTRKPVDMNHPSLRSALPPSMFMTQRNASSGGALSFAFPVSAGTYEVRLYFAEIRAKQMAPGARVMNVALENHTVLNNYDVFKAAGGHRGVMKSFTVTSDESLEIRITATQSRPMVNGLEIVSTGSAPASVPEPSPEPDPEPSPEPEPSPPPATTCKGTLVPAGTNLHTIIDGVDGRTFCLEAGSYNIGDSPLAPGDNVTIAGADGVRSDKGAIDAPTQIVGSASVAIIEAGNDNTFRWLDISGSQPGAACQPDCGRGIKSGPNMLVEYSHIHHNSNNGIGGGTPNAVRVRFSELDRNGTDEFKGTYGAIKQAATKTGGALIVTDSYVHDNVGLGIWGDRCQDRLIAKRNLVTGNSRDGIRWETDMAPGDCSNTSTRSALIQHNTARGNGTDPSGGDAGIKIRNSPNAEVSFNSTGGNEERGIKVLYNDLAGANLGNVIRDNISPDGIDGCDYAGVTCLRNL